jgi:two-component system nitrate/nitrite response regulator NarL
MSIIRIIVVANDPNQMQALSAALDQQDSMGIISIVSSHETAIKQLTAGPDIMLLNPEVLKDHSLSRFIHTIQTKSSRTRIIHLLQRTPPDDDLIRDIKAGVRGYIKTTDSPAIMIKAIQAVFNGEIWAERRILEKAISNALLLPEILNVNVPGLAPLTNREKEMLTLVMQGESNKEIAARSSISERTVKTHLYRVYRKLNVKSRTKAIALLSHS